MKLETSREITEFTIKMNNQLWNRMRTSISPTGENLLQYQLIPESFGATQTSPMINEGRVDVHIFIFFGYEK